MALEQNIRYTPEQMTNFAAGVRRSTVALGGTPYSAKSSVPKLQSYKNLSSVKPTYDKNEKRLPVGTQLGDLGVITTTIHDSTRYEKDHYAVDIANKAGTPIKAFTGGTVTEVVSGKKHGDKGFGNYVVVQDKEGNYHRYSHLNKQYVPLNSRVEKGQVIGGMGATGSTYSQSPDPKRLGEHLDYRVYDENKKALNPFAYIMSDYYNSVQK